MERVTNELYKVTDDAGNVRLVRGVDAREIEAVAASDKEGEGAVSMDIPDGSTVDPNLQIEGVTTTPRTLLKDNASNFPVNNSLLRETQNSGNNIVGGDGKKTGDEKTEDREESETMESLMEKSRGELEKLAVTRKIDGAGYPNKTELAKAIFKAK